MFFIYFAVPSKKIREREICGKPCGACRDKKKTNEEMKKKKKIQEIFICFEINQKNNFVLSLKENPRGEKKNCIFM